MAQPISVSYIGLANFTVLGDPPLHITLERKKPTKHPPDSTPANMPETISFLSHRGSRGCVDMVQFSTADIPSCVPWHLHHSVPALTFCESLSVTYEEAEHQRDLGQWFPLVSQSSWGVVLCIRPWASSSSQDESKCFSLSLLSSSLPFHKTTMITLLQADSCTA